jgi:hypothetical protein
MGMGWFTQTRQGCPNTVLDCIGLYSSLPFVQCSDSDLTLTQRSAGGHRNAIVRLSYPIWRCSFTVASKHWRLELKPHRTAPY